MDKKDTRVILIYNVLLAGAILVSFPLLVVLILFSRKRRKTVLRRLGLSHLPEQFAGIHSGAGAKPVWVHALSVGEAVSAQGLLKALRCRIRPRPLVLSVSTKTGFELAEKRLKGHVDALFYFPFDLMFAVKRISSRINPALLVLVESDVWPNCLFEMVRRKVPVMLVNARLSKRSFSGYRRAFFFSETMFSFFTKICAQTDGDAARLKIFAAKPGRVVTSGNLKFDHPYETISPKEMASLRRALNILPEQRVFVAGSTHPGEELILKNAFTALRKKHHDLCLVIAPRDPARAGAIVKIFSDGGFLTVPYSATIGGGEIKKAPAVVVIDVIGLLARLYSLANMAFVGGSLVDFRGHNPLEPAAFSKPVLFGPFMSDFKDIAAMLIESGGAIQVHTAGDIILAGERMLADGDVSEIMGQHNFKVFCANKGAVEKTMDDIMMVLAQSETICGDNK